LRTQATQDIRRRIAACFVAVERSSGRIAASYTLVAASIPTNELPPEWIKRLPRYPALLAVRIGRLAVDLDFQGKGLGAALLGDALRRILVAPPAAFAMLVDAKDENAVTFYAHHAFQLLIGRPRTLFLPVATAEKILPGQNRRSKAPEGENH
jgi:GNAT superfamily N-acetyltransferase